jgi:uncharacterized RDD family membrane protein YckC
MEQKSSPEYVGFLLRAAAYVIDFLFPAAIWFCLIFVFAITLYIEIGEDAADKVLDSRSFDVICSIIFLFYYIYFMSGPWQATPGKRILGMYVIRTNGKRISAWFAFGRNFAYVLDMITFGAGFLMIIWTDQKKALHDIVCGTRVIRGKL